MNKYNDGFLQSNLDRCRNEISCEGSCDRHEGETVVVRIIDYSGSPHDWGYFAYCEASIKEDIARGFSVIREGEDGFLPCDVKDGIE